MQPDEDMALWSTVRQADAIRTGAITSRGLLELLIARVERINPTLNAVVTVDLERARAAFIEEGDLQITLAGSEGIMHFEEK